MFCQIDKNKKIKIFGRIYDVTCFVIKSSSLYIAHIALFIQSLILIYEFGHLVIATYDVVTYEYTHQQKEQALWAVSMKVRCIGLSDLLNIS